MQVKLRSFELSDAKDIAVQMNNLKVQNNLRDGIPFPYTEQDGIAFIESVHTSQFI